MNRMIIRRPINIIHHITLQANILHLTTNQVNMKKVNIVWKNAHQVIINLLNTFLKNAPHLIIKKAILKPKNIPPVTLKKKSIHQVVIFMKNQSIN